LATAAVCRSSPSVMTRVEGGGDGPQIMLINRVITAATSSPTDVR
jgi:hypothetical protein